MISDDQNIKINYPKNQLNLYGYSRYFKTLAKIFNKNKSINVILLQGPKGLGKATFIYHFVNYLLSYNEEKKYSIEAFKIDPNNISYKLINNNTHPNFFLVENNPFDEKRDIFQAICDL